MSLFDQGEVYICNRGNQRVSREEVPTQTSQNRVILRFPHPHFLFGAGGDDALSLVSGGGVAITLHACQ